MFFDNSEDVIRKVARVLREPEELLQLRFEVLHLGLLPGQSVPHTLQNTSRRVKLELQQQGRESDWDLSCKVTQTLAAMVTSCK